jgi:hypothetical protein
MSSWFIPGLARQQIELLNRERVSFSPLTVGDESGVVVDNSGLSTVVHVLQAVNYRHTPSCYEGIRRVELEYERPVTGTARGANGSQSQTLTQLTEQINNLKEWNNLTEWERQARQGLTARIRDTTVALQSATAKQRDLDAKLSQLNEHAGALEALAVPVRILTSLRNFIGKEGEAAQTNRQEVQRLSGELQSAREALQEDIRRKRQSPEDAIATADATLAEANRMGVGER